jgi:arsenical pump membrane protein
VDELAGYGTLGLTVGLVLARPRYRALEVGPAAAIAVGIALMASLGLVGYDEVKRTAGIVWRPLVAVAAIMIMTTAADLLGALRQVAAVAMARRGQTATRFFVGTFVMSALTAAVLNNDAAILLLTPLVMTTLPLVYPELPGLRLPFAFAVFMGAGVAPLVVSNPMNLIVASYAGIGFNEYLVRMLPVAVASWAVTLAVLLAVFRRDLRAAPPVGPRPEPGPWRPSHVHVLALLGTVMAAYPAVAYAKGPIWVVAAAGAVLALGLCRLHLGRRAHSVAAAAIPWQVLLFLAGMLTMAFGLENAGIVDRLGRLYDGAGLALVGLVSAVGSAVLNNHPMALINLLSLEVAEGAADALLLAALVGGDLGPRLLPIGSLAGLLWLELLRRGGLRVPLRRFVSVGAVVTAPSLVASLAVLSLTA